MRKHYLLSIISAMGLIFTIAANAQDGPQNFGKKITPCGSTEYEAILKAKHSSRATVEQFEEWIAPKVEALKNKRTLRSAQQTSNILSIPVVVHVIHNGDAVGTEENISEGQIMSQITVLNQDYRRMADTPGFNENPVGADVEIEFCLAQRDPNGLPTNGIVRHFYSNTTWNMNNIDGTLKPETQWDPNLYLNLWVVNDITIDFFGMAIPGIKGYAQFPSVSGLDGLDGEVDIAYRSGVVIGYKYFGSPLEYPQGNYDSDDVRGRTATHEIGHFLGLRHIWGDGDCDADDFCEDTPISASATEGTCPSGQDTCPNSPGLDMIENYMDYSSEGCMNVFTKDQKYRILAVLQNSPRRASLTTSQACLAAEELINDGSIHIQGINVEGCSTEFYPSLKLFNSGTAPMLSAVINYDVDGGTVLVYNWSGNLETGQETVVNLPVASAIPGVHTLNTTVTLVNGLPDESSFNSIRSRDFKIAANIDVTQVIVEIQQDAFGSETTWQVTNSGGTVVASGGPYQDIMDQNAELPTHTQTLALVANDCYTFTIQDSGNNGIVGMFGAGHYLVSTSNTLIGSGGPFSSSESVSFGVNYALGLDKNEGLSGISVYPVPSGNNITVSIPVNVTIESYTIFNNLGQIIDSKETGEHEIIVNINDYPEGVYYIRLAGKGQQKVVSFIKK